jgi:dTDP-4-dehydrorhamnose 3,5-epimerase
MRLNIVVPVGAIRFYFVIENSSGNTPETASVELSPSNYLRLTVEPGVWMGFEGMAEGPNVLLNVASVPHDPAESMNKDEDVWMYLFEN